MARNEPEQMTKEETIQVLTEFAGKLSPPLSPSAFTDSVEKVAELPEQLRDEFLSHLPTFEKNEITSYDFVRAMDSFVEHGTVNDKVPAVMKTYDNAKKRGTTEVVYNKDDVVVIQTIEIGWFTALLTDANKGIVTHGLMEDMGHMDEASSLLTYYVVFNFELPSSSRYSVYGFVVDGFDDTLYSIHNRYRDTYSFLAEMSAKTGVPPTIFRTHPIIKEMESICLSDDSRAALDISNSLKRDVGESLFERIPNMLSMLSEVIGRADVDSILHKTCESDIHGKSHKDIQELFSDNMFINVLTAMKIRRFLACAAKELENDEFLSVINGLRRHMSLNDPYLWEDITNSLTQDITGVGNTVSNIAYVLSSDEHKKQIGYALRRVLSTATNSIQKVSASGPFREYKRQYDALYTHEGYPYWEIFEEGIFVKLTRKYKSDKDYLSFVADNMNRRKRDKRAYKFIIEGMIKFMEDDGYTYPIIATKEGREFVKKLIDMTDTFDVLKRFYDEQNTIVGFLMYGYVPRALDRKFEESAGIKRTPNGKTYIEVFDPAVFDSIMFNHNYMEIVERKLYNELHTDSNGMFSGNNDEETSIAVINMLDDYNLVVVALECNTLYPETSSYVPMDVPYKYANNRTELINKRNSPEIREIKDGLISMVDDAYADEESHDMFDSVFSDVLVDALILSYKDIGLDVLREIYLINVGEQLGEAAIFSGMTYVERKNHYDIGIDVAFVRDNIGYAMENVELRAGHVSMLYIMSILYNNINEKVDLSDYLYTYEDYIPSGPSSKTVNNKVRKLLKEAFMVHE